MNYMKYLLVVLAIGALPACSDDDDDDVHVPPSEAGAELRVTHASPDAPQVNVYVDGALALENVDYKVSSGILNRAAAATTSAVLFCRVQPCTMAFHSSIRAVRPLIFARSFSASSEPRSRTSRIRGS